MKENFKHVEIYCDFKEEGQIFYVRLCPLETDRFRHGLPIAGRFSKREDCVEFANEVDQYFEDVLNCFERKFIKT